MWIISVPLKVQISKKGYFALNLNVYRNAHYMTLNKAKVVFKELITPFLVQIPKLKRCSLEYVLYPKTNRLCDVSNVCSIVDKFFSDAFVESGHLEDDNYTFIKDIKYRFGAVDSKNPRVDVIITTEEPVKGKNTMQIILVESEIKEAIKLYMQKNIGLSEDRDIAVEFVATRGSDGLKANIDVLNKTVVKPEPVEPEKTEPDKSLEEIDQEMVEEEDTFREEPEKESPSEDKQETSTAHSGKSLFAGMKRPQNN